MQSCTMDVNASGLVSGLVKSANKVCVAPTGSASTVLRNASRSTSAKKSRGRLQETPPQPIWRLPSGDILEVPQGAAHPLCDATRTAAANATRIGVFCVAASSMAFASGEASPMAPRHQSNAARASESFSSLIACLNRGPKSLTCSGKRPRTCAVPANHRYFVWEQVASQISLLQDSSRRSRTFSFSCVRMFFKIWLLPPKLSGFEARLHCTSRYDFPSARRRSSPESRHAEGPKAQRRVQRGTGLHMSLPHKPFLDARYCRRARTGPRPADRAERGRDRSPGTSSAVPYA